MSILLSRLYSLESDRFFKTTTPLSTQLGVRIILASICIYKEKIVREHLTGPQRYPDNGLVSGTRGEVSRNQEEEEEVIKLCLSVVSRSKTDEREEFWEGIQGVMDPGVSIHVKAPVADAQEEVAPIAEEPPEDAPHEVEGEVPDVEEPVAAPPADGGDDPQPIVAQPRVRSSVLLKILTASFNTSRC
ncbi:hypothetical protein AVEN_240729-1 [Araneus ventricosus]|uniref:Uncharacterized protein n=1 Tax=Araneus ventricosus TaxID=182803 RepID=A0A4Y2JSE6_ARAVE|nr:hypothetical protein AVEN_240729-1 [Araneus ventricosus]